MLLLRVFSTCSPFPLSRPLLVFHQVAATTTFPSELCFLSLAIYRKTFLWPILIFCEIPARLSLLHFSVTRHLLPATDNPPKLTCSRHPADSLTCLARDLQQFRHSYSASGPAFAIARKCYVVLPKASSQLLKDTTSTRSCQFVHV